MIIVKLSEQEIEDLVQALIVAVSESNGGPQHDRWQELLNRFQNGATAD